MGVWECPLIAFLQMEVEISSAEKLPLVENHWTLSDRLILGKSVRDAPLNLDFDSLELGLQTP